MTVVPDYPFIRLWHETSGSFPYYINDLVNKAKNENAPPTAIFRGDDGWKVVDDIKSLDTAYHLYRNAGRYGEKCQAHLSRLIERLQEPSQV
jgi:hypothetical protein